MSPGPFTRLPGTPSDQRLLASARDGDERAFETVVRRHIRALLRYCRRMGLSDSRAEDVVQQSLLQAWLALQRGREVRSPKAWLYRTVHNTAVNVIRASGDDHAQLEDGTLVDHLASVESDFERRLAARQALSDVAALPQMQRDAILLTAIEGRSHEDVASALGVTHGAVRGLLYRARATLRDTAAAVVPAPVLAWLGACLARVAPAASRLAELSPAGGGDMGGALAKGVALTGTAAVLAVGTGIVPVGRPAHGSKTPVLALGIGGASAGAVTSSSASVETLPPALLSPSRIESSADIRARKSSGRRHRRHDGAAGSSGRRAHGSGDERLISDDPLRLGSRESSRSDGDAILGADGVKSGSSTASGSGRDGSRSSGTSGSDGSHDRSPRLPGSDGSAAANGAEAPPPQPQAGSDGGGSSGSGDGGSGKSPEPIVVEPSK